VGSAQIAHNMDMSVRDVSKLLMEDQVKGMSISFGVLTELYLWGDSMRRKLNSGSPQWK